MTVIGYGFLAGVVYLPSNVAGAQTAAQQEAEKNGYTNGAGGVTVTATPEALNNRILGVTVSSPVRSWFARLLGITQFSARRNARAEFVLPVPMGSPEVFKQKRDVLAGHCAEIGRDPAGITTSVHIRLPKSGDVGPLVDEAAAYADAGVDLGIVYLPPPHTPAVLEPVAQALRPLAG